MHSYIKRDHFGLSAWIVEPGKLAVDVVKHYWLHVIILKYCNILICNNFWHFHVWPVSRTMYVYISTMGCIWWNTLPLHTMSKRGRNTQISRYISARAIENKPIKKISVLGHHVRYSQLWFIFCQQYHWEIRRFTTGFCCFTTLVVLKRCLRCVKNNLRVVLKRNQYNSCGQNCDQQLWSK